VALVALSVSLTVCGLGAAGFFGRGPFPTANLDLSGSAYRACEDFVSEHLETPADAGFAGRFSEDTRVFSRATSAGREFKVSSHVDAQNVAGARLRQWFLCTATWGIVGERNEWTSGEITLTPWTAGKPVFEAGGPTGVYVRTLTPEELAKANEPFVDPSANAAIEMTKRSRALPFNYRLSSNEVLTNPGDPVLHDTEHAIQNELAHMTGTLHVVGWAAKRIDGQTYLVSYLFDDTAGTQRGWFFEANTAASIVRNVLEDEALKAKYHLQ
jgi:hypothetical protein